MAGPVRIHGTKIEVDGNDACLGFVQCRDKASEIVAPDRRTTGKFTFPVLLVANENDRREGRLDGARAVAAHPLVKRVAPFDPDALLSELVANVQAQREDGCDSEPVPPALSAELLKVLCAQDEWRLYHMAVRCHSQENRDTVSSETGSTPDSMASTLISPSSSSLSAAGFA